MEREPVRLADPEKVTFVPVRSLDHAFGMGSPEYKPENLISGKSSSGKASYRGKHRSHNKGMGLKAFFRSNWMKRYR